MDPIVIPTLETERLRLRAFERNDFEDYAALNADPEVMRYVGGTWDRGRSWRHLAFQIGHWLLRGSGMWVVERKETGAFVGMVGFSEPEGWPGFELAGRLGRRWWGHGCATEAAREALAYAFTVLKKDCVISLVRPDNRASIRLVERLGETVQGRTEILGTEYFVYGMDRAGWRSSLPAPTLPLGNLLPAPVRFLR